MLPKWMRLKDYCEYSGIPPSLIKDALHGDFGNLIGRKINPNKENSPFLINREKADKLFEAKEI